MKSVERNIKYPLGAPSEFLAKKLSDEIRSRAAEAENQKCLHEKQLNIVHHQNWLNMYVPEAFGGLGLSLPEILRIEEGLSWADGSTGWVVTLCSGAAWFLGFLDAAIAQEIFATKDVCFAGSGAVTGTAARTSDGYEINGYWKYATGSLHASVFTVNCHIFENDKPLHHPDGSAVIQSFLLKPKEVIVHQTWNSMGMVATGSHAIEVSTAHIPVTRSFIIDAANAKMPDDIFRYPFLQLAETTLAVNLSGMAYRFLDLCEEYSQAKIQASRTVNELARKTSDAKSKLNAYRNIFYGASDAAWDFLIHNKTIPVSMLASVSDASLALVYHAREIINTLYPLCGLTAADTSTEINRVWRNFHTAGQHSLFNR